MERTMKYLVLVLCICALPLRGQSIGEVRRAYPMASASKEEATAFVALMAKAPAADVVLSAYKGASLMILAKFGGKRTALLKEGKALIEGALAQEPENAELHLIRLSVQQNLPKIVPYRNNIAADKAFLKAHYSKQPADLQAYISGFLELK